MRRPREVLVLGLGNILLGDDGIGVHVVRRLAAEPTLPPGVHAMDGGTLGFRLMDALMQSDAALFIDAADLRQPAGTLALLEHEELAAYTRGGVRRSAHEAGLADLLTLLALNAWAPSYLAVLGIQPQGIDWQEHLSDEVARAMPAACSTALATVLRWQAAA